MQVFHALVSWDNGEPKSHGNRNLRPKRVYFEIGKTNLADNGWTEIAPSNRDGRGFFRVKVEMK